MPERTSPGRRALAPGVLALLLVLCCPVAGYCPPAPDAEALLTGAWAEYGTNHYPQAERIAREVLAAASDAETLAAAAQVLVLSRLEQGDFAGARTEAQRAGSDTLLKQVTEREHRYQEDMAGCRKAATEAPTSEARAEALLALGEAELRYGRLQAAREAFAGVSGQYPGTPAAAKAEARLALVAAASGDVEGIIQAAEATLAGPDAEAAATAIVRATDALLLVGGCTDRALSWLAEIRARRPGSRAAHAAVYAQARVYDRQGDPQAADTYREAACLMPESDLARRAVGDIADLSLRSGQGAAGQEMLTALAQAAPKLAGACWYYRGRLYAAQDPPAAEQAEAAWRQAVATGPTAPEALPAAEALVSLLVGGGRYSLATTFVEETEKAAGPGELAARCRYLLGEICRRRGYPVSAEQAYTAVLTKYPKSQQVWAATLGLQEVARAYLGDYQADRAEAVLARLGKRLEPGAGLPADLAAKARACLAEMRRSEAMAQNTRGYHLGAARLMAPLVTNPDSGHCTTENMVLYGLWSEALGRYGNREWLAQAVWAFGRLVGGMEPNPEVRKIWRAHLERCQAIAEAH